MEQLFSQNFHEFERQKKNDVTNKIKALDMQLVLSTTSEELQKKYEEQFRGVFPYIESENKYQPEAPKEFKNGAHTYIQFAVYIPVSGDAMLLKYRPSYYQYPSMSREVNAGINLKKNEIQLSYKKDIKNKEDSNKFYEEDIKWIETNLKTLSNEVTNYNSSISNLIKKIIAERKAEAKNSESQIQSITIPIKKRANIPATYNIPEVRRKLEPPRTVETFTREPTLDIEEYEDILIILQNMALAMERSPKTFETLTEEEIRNFFIVFLNGHYEGNATGETFNGNGKTDILIRYNNENAFIAECKFWKGQIALTKAIDEQLLKYITWRDTKTAIILFNKNVDLSSVLSTAKEILIKHHNFKSEYQFKSSKLKNDKTIIPCKFKHPSDSEKEFYLTLLAFQVNKTG